MRVLCIVDWPETGRWLWDYVPGTTDDRIDFHILQGGENKLPGFGKFLRYYPPFFFGSFGVLPRLSQYDVILAHENKNTFSIALMKRLLGFRRPKLVALNFSVRGPLMKLGGLLRFALASCDSVSYLSEGERDFSHTFLKLPPEKARIIPMGFTPMEHIQEYFRNPKCDLPPGSFIFASGRSYRDYGTLFEAVKDLPVQVVVNAEPICLAGLTIPPNVSVNPMLPRELYYGLIAHSKFVVVPLQATEHGAGESAITESMAAGKALIVTRNPSTTCYIRQGETGYLVEPGDAHDLRAKIQHLLDHPEETQAIGAARYNEFLEEYTYEAYARRVDRYLRDICGEEQPIPATG